MLLKLLKTFIYGRFIPVLNSYIRDLKMLQISGRILCISICLILQACWSDTYAPVVNAWHDPAALKSRYRVQNDDTLYSIACAFEMDYRDLAEANHLNPPYHIEPGQTLTMVVSKRKPSTDSQIKDETKVYAVAECLAEKQSAGFEEIPLKVANETMTTPSQSKPNEKKLAVEKIKKADPDLNIPPPILETKNIASGAEQTVVQLPAIGSKKQFVVRSSQPSTQEGAPSQIRNSARWLWPTVGKIARGFNPQSNEGGNKGIDIKGEFGAPVRSVASGQVVYCGNGLPGYGNLVIIKHNTEYLTLYGYNSQLMVKEGDYVKAGKPIAKIGRTNNGSTLLHFEVRRFGKPINPLNYLRVN